MHSHRELDCYSLLCNHTMYAYLDLRSPHSGARDLPCVQLSDSVVSHSCWQH